MHKIFDDKLVDAQLNNWVDQYAHWRVKPYLKLSRLDRPIGSWLLIIPCWWGLLLSTNSNSVDFDQGTLYIAAACYFGGILTRGAGCTWNDLTDSDLDAMWTFADSDSGDTQLDFQIHWYLNGVHMVQYDNVDPLPSSEITKGETWHFEIRVSDGIQWSSWFVTQSITISNSAPVVTDVQHRNRRLYFSHRRLVHSSLWREARGAIWVSGTIHCAVSTLAQPRQLAVVLYELCHDGVARCRHRTGNVDHRDYPGVQPATGLRARARLKRNGTLRCDSNSINRLGSRNLGLARWLCRARRITALGCGPLGMVAV